MRRLACFSLGWVLALALAVWALPKGLWTVLLGGLLLMGLLCLWLLRGRNDRSLWLRRGCCILLGAAVSMGWFLAWDGLWYSAAEKAVGEEPEICTLRLIDTPWETKYGSAVYARLSGPRPIRTLVYLQDSDSDLEAGDRITGKFLVSLSAETSDYYDASGTLLIAKQRGDFAVVSGAGNPLYFPQRAARALKQVIDRCFSDDSRGLVKALMTGDRNDLSDTFSSDLKQTGIYHGVAISGLHVSLLAGLLQRLFGKKKRLAAAVTLPLLILFALMTRAAPSVCRAVVMETVLLLAPLFGRDYDAPTGLCTAVLLLLLPNPLAISHVGLQLSVASVAGLILFSGKPEELLLSRPLCTGLVEKGGIRSWGCRAVCASLGTTCGALVFSMPLLAAYFGTVSIIAPLTNLLGLWAVTWTFVSGGITAVLGLIWLPLGEALAFLPELGVLWLRGLCGMLSRLPFACLSTQNDLVWVFLGAVYLAVLFWVVRRPGKIVILAGCCAAVFCITAAAPILLSRQSDYDFRVLDVGQGQCILLTSRNASAIIDCGGSSGARAGELAAALCRTKGERNVDLLILTHYDADHTNGIEQLLHGVSVKKVLLPLIAGEEERMESIRQLALKSGAESVLLEEDTNVVFGVGRLRIMTPEEGGDENSCGAVLASFGDMDFLVTGDQNEKAEAALLERSGICDVEVLVAGHHGAADSTGQALLDALQPDTVIISVGKNSYGHPAEQTLSRIREAGAVCLRTDRSGTIKIRK